MHNLTMAKLISFDILAFMKMLTMDPLWDIKRADALRLICDFCRGPGSTYPIFDHHTMMNIANRVFGSLESAQGGKLKERGLAAAEAIFNAHTNKLKVVIAIGRTLESGGRSDQAQRLFQSVTEAVEGLLWNSDGICGIQLLVLVVWNFYTRIFRRQLTVTGLILLSP